MAKHPQRRESEDEPVKLDCFKNQPNINMAIPWIYEICKTMTSNTNRDAGDEEEPVNLDCFKNQPNINMAIPWIYQIYRSVTSGGSGIFDIVWDDMTDKGGEINIVDEEGE